MRKEEEGTPLRADSGRLLEERAAYDSGRPGYGLPSNAIGTNANHKRGA